ncbi:MAG: toll/interleukin-1 receptor domain-containing protein [Desulfarculus sp.]|nr:toll/interleukin-1 receptor domain-containing protein [Desulfarculus sp.]
MANPEHLAILRQGVEAWNKWRVENPEVRPRLVDADLQEADLRRANLAEADLRWANLSQANLRWAYLPGVDLRGVTLVKANFSDADLRWADLRGADLRGADLRKARLADANLSRANFARADMTEAWIGLSSLGGTDLSQVKGLETVGHLGPSSIGIDTIYRSGGKIPESFLRGAGVPEDFITYMRSLVNNPIEYYSCFISYSSRDEEFAQRLHADLQAKGVRCWFAPHDMKTGDKIRERIDESIRVYDKLLLVLSGNSIFSNWVEKEVETAFEEEQPTRKNRTVLFPIRLDDEVMGTDKAWAADIRRTRHIGDFRQWQQHSEYKKAFDRLLRDLKASAQAAG